MRFSPSHRDESALHSALRDALNEELENKDFFVWLDVRPTGKAREFDDLGKIVAETEGWLGSLDPDAVEEKKLPKRHFDQEAASVEITALPRKPEVRDHRADEIVGNPGPILIGWDE